MRQSTDGDIVGTGLGIGPYVLKADTPGDLNGDASGVRARTLDGLAGKFGRHVVEQHGFRASKIYQLNKIGMPAWGLYGKVLHRKQISKVMLKAFDKTVWFWRRVDGLLPWRGLSLVIVGQVGNLPPIENRPLKEATK